MDWTVERVKQELPEVQVRFNWRGGPTTIQCVVCGRKNKFATVMPFEFGSATKWQFAWETIARALNTDKALQV